MKAEFGYPDVVMGDFIEDLIGDIEYNMGLVPANDSYFRELGLQRFTLEQLLREIDQEEGVSPNRRSGAVCRENVRIGKRHWRPRLYLFRGQRCGPVHSGRIIFQRLKLERRKTSWRRPILIF
jgi:hypothetical protein